MNKKIFTSVAVTAVVSVILTSSFLWAALGASLSSLIEDSLRRVQVTIADQTGKIIFDNKFDEWENYPIEIEQALEFGAGEAVRYSAAASETTYYYAERLPNKNVLRTALSAGAVYKLFNWFVPSIILCAIVALIITFSASKRLTEKIAKPINALDLSVDTLDVDAELLPFVRKIRVLREDSRKREILAEKQAADILSITENMREGVLLFDDSGTALLANGAVSRILDVENPVGKIAAELCRDKSFLEGVKSCLRGEDAEMTLKRNGGVFAVMFSPANAGAVALFIDITDKLTAEKQRREFSANVSHELKTPLTTIMGRAELLSNGTVKEEDVKTFACKIQTNADRLLAIIEDVIRLSEFDEGDAAKEFTRFDIMESAVAAAESLRLKAEKANVTIKVNGESTLINANRRMIDELLYNLTDNAVKYNIKDGRVDIFVSKINEFCKIEVRDTGIGIAPEYLSRVFERFYRVDKSRSKLTGGTGLGLAIVKHIAEFHNGQAEITSKVNEGTSVFCTILA